MIGPVTKTTWQITRALFDSCIDASADIRRELLSQASDDARKEVIDLLAVADRESSSRERYRAITVLDTGGSGLVFRAHDEVTHEDVILKMFKIRADKHSEAVRSLKQHLTVDDPKVALTDWLDGSVDSDRMGWIISKPSHGRPLLQWIKTDNPQLGQRIRVFKAIAETMSTATNLGLPAVWPKPNQVLIDSEGVLQLTDLGFIEHFAVSPHKAGTAPQDTAQIGTMRSLANILFEDIDTSMASDPLALISQIEDADL